MKFSIGDKVIIRADIEEMQNDMLELADGQEAVITEIYQNVYEPDVDRFEVELVHPVKYDGREVIVVPGLYLDNLELAERVNEAKRAGRSTRKISRMLNNVNEKYAVSFNTLSKSKIK